MRMCAGLLALGLSLMVSGGVQATKPCSPGSWVADKDRPAAEWRKTAKWVAVAKVIGRKEIVEPYVNCYAKDRSECAMEDRSIITVRVIRFEKGKEKIKRLTRSYCGPPPPLTTGGIFRFYGVDARSYIYFERLKAAPPKQKQGKKAETGIR